MVTYLGAEIRESSLFGKYFFQGIDAKNNYGNEYIILRDPFVLSRRIHA